jgi:hypothetical protein
MAKYTVRKSERDAAYQSIKRLFQAPHGVFALHYACDHFIDPTRTTSARIVAICVLDLGHRQGPTFSLSRSAEKLKIDSQGFTTQLDKVERDMLGQFFKYVRAHKDKTWLHWNMLSSSYGFQALEHRFSVLGGSPHVIPNDRRVSLSNLLKSLYTDRFETEPRIKALADRNQLSTKQLLEGKEEPERFRTGDLSAVDFSVHRKTQLICEFAKLAYEKKLKTAGNKSEIYGSNVGAFFESYKEHYLSGIFQLIGALTTAGGLLYAAYKFISGAK